MLRPIVQRSLKTSDYVGLCAGEIWKRILTLPQFDSASSKDTSLMKTLLKDYIVSDLQLFRREIEEVQRALQRLAELAQNGMACCRILEESDTADSKNLSVIGSEGQKIEEIDKEITITGFKLPAVNHLVLDFNFIKQNLEGKDLVSLARNTNGLYSRLFLISSEFDSLLGCWPELFQESGWFETDTIQRNVVPPPDYGSVTTDCGSERSDPSMVVVQNQT